MDIEVREAYTADILKITDVIEAAFGEEEGPILVELVSALLKDETAMPLWSLVAVSEERLLGHVLFTSTHLKPQMSGDRSVIMAPLAVDPDCQRQGIGGKLIAHGLERLRGDGIQLVFVLGDPAYYTRHGFVPAGAHGFEAHYPVPEKHAEAWMVQELAPGAIKRFEGSVRCADALDDVKYWVE